MNFLEIFMYGNVENLRVLGYEIGATKVIGIVGTIEGTVLRRIDSKSRNGAGPEPFIDQLWALKDKLINDDEYSTIQAISVTFPGIINKKGETVYAPNMSGWQKVKFADTLREKFKKPIILENDANAHALAEKLYGVGRPYKNFVYFTVGSGIGGAIIIDNKLYKGHNGWAGEFGHMVIRAYGPNCGCGRQGCVEALASGKAIAKLARVYRNYGKTELTKYKKDMLDAKLVFEAKNKGDKIAIAVIKEVAEYMAIAIANIIEILDPEAIIIGGGVTKHNEAYIEQLRTLIMTELGYYARTVKIIRASETMIAKAPLAVALYHKIHEI